MKEVVLPSKLYFKIGEVAKIVGVKPYVLRYWETEFGEIGPVKSRTGQRLYRRRDVETILRLKGLLYDEGYTLAGARKRIRELTRNGRFPEQLPLNLAEGKTRQALTRVRRGLEEVLKVLET